MGEYRLYYDDNGKVLCYTVEDLPGDYIIVDHLTYLKARPDLIVSNGRLIQSNEGAVITKLEPSLYGTNCYEGDINIVITEDDNYVGPVITWNIKQNEFKYN
jgi:hypothetical protein